MSKQISSLILLLSALIISSCNRVKMSDDNTAKPTSIDSSEIEISEDNEECDTTEKRWEYTSQYEFNEAYVKEATDYENIVESDFQNMVSLFPKYKDLFNNEKKKYDQYLEAVLVVSDFGDHGSSSPCFWSDMRHQSVELRNASFEKMLLHLQGEEVTFPKTKFTNSMIDQAYQAFISSIYKNADMYREYEESELEEYKSNLKKEQKRWNEWMSYRSVVSSRLPQELREIYDGCTNITKRIKLRQVKNQNQALGVTGHEPCDCILPENCTDKDLLEYPGFDKIWVKHIEEDWYPTFEE